MRDVESKKDTQTDDLRIVKYHGRCSSLCRKKICAATCVGLLAGIAVILVAPGGILHPSGTALGSCTSEVQIPLRWGSDRTTANQICCHNSYWAEYSGYWEKTSFLATESGTTELTFYDSATGLPLFIAPRGRSWGEFVTESRAHGWPSFRDSEVVWSNVRVIGGGETVSVNGTHLGHNLPDRSGNRYCINIVCVAGIPPS